MADAIYRSDSEAEGQPQRDVGDAAGREVGRFFVDVIERAGGPGELAGVLAELGFPYTESAVRSWRGTKRPGPDVMFALAKRFRISLDHYALAKTLLEEINELKGRVEALEAGAA